ncbi:IRSp53/MIM-like domain-containing protein [Phthorimaea operculella]|nr:IRSp53/MIM-like domain-containing protein [Phthorimaea operculella]
MIGQAGCSRVGIPESILRKGLSFLFDGALANFEETLNILDKFNPGARQMITAGKAYLKALHGAAAASRLYVDAVGKLGRQAQQGTWGGCADIGTALMKVVEVYREIQDQQMNILKAFYVDLLVPLETNLEKDTKVVQSEQKRFLQQHKLRSESYSKAAATIKKQRKKKTTTSKVGSAMDKEMKNMQILEEEKTKLDAFCEQSLKNAMTQERRRYGFVLERQCSLAKHWLAYHAAGATAYNAGLEEWLEVSKTREYLPPNVEAMFVSRMRQVSFWADEEVYASPRIGDDDDRASVGSALRKTRSVDASCLDVRSIGELGSPTQGLSRAKSDFNLHSGEPESDTRPATRPSSLAPPTSTPREPPLARALYAYAAAGDNQLSFQQGDVLALLGERTKGWQYGENLRSHHAGWFPLAYTEPIPSKDDCSGTSPARWSVAQTPSEAPPPAPMTHAQVTGTPTIHSHAHPPTRIFGDTITAHHINKGRLGSGSPGLPPTLPAPSPSALSTSASANFHTSTPAPPANTAIKNSTSAASFTTHAVIETRTFGPQTLPLRSTVAQNKTGPAKTAVTAVAGNVSLHSSNDSGFSNEPPPQPDVDYSDEEAQRLRVPISKSAQLANDHKAYLLKTQSLKRPQKSANTNGYLTDDQQLMLRNMLDMDKDSQKVKRTKSFWKFGRTTSEEIMEGMSLWQHRDIVDTVPEYKKKLFVKLKKELRPAPEVPEPRKQASPEKLAPIENGVARPKETIDRREVKVTNGIRQARSLGSIQSEERMEKARKSGEMYQPPINKKSMSEKSIAEEKHEDFVQRNESRHSDLTNSSTIKTNFENSFYNDENGEGFVMKTVKRREILQRYDNDSSSEVNSVASSTDPYDCIIVDDHMTSKKQQELDRRRQAQMREDEMKKRKENAYMPEFEEIEITPIKPHVRATMNSEKSKPGSHEHSPSKTMEFKTFKDNSKEIKTFSASSETLKYKDNEHHNTDRYGIPTERNNNVIRNEDPYNGHDEGTLKYNKKRSSKEEKSRTPNIVENGRNHKKDYPQTETRSQKKDSRPYDNRESREPRIDYSLDRREMRKDYNTNPKNRDPRNRSRTNRSYDDSSLPHNGRRDERYYESNISYFSDQERRVSRYDYETDSKKAEKSKMRQEEARLEGRRFVDHRSEGPYSESDDQKFNEALKQQRPQLLPRTKLLKRNVDGSELTEDGHTFGPWYDLWGRENGVYK